MRRFARAALLATLLCIAAAGVYADSVKVDFSTQLTASVYAVHWATVTNSISFIGLIGLHIPVVPIGPGRLGIDTGNIVGDILATIVTTALGGGVNATKLNIGVYYSFAF